MNYLIENVVYWLESWLNLNYIFGETSSSGYSEKYSEFQI